MRKRVMTFPSCDGRTDIHAVCWTPGENEVQAVVQIVHGMTEFVERYEPFARFLTERGFAVVGHDHLGHGASIVSKEDWGYFAGERGASCLLGDMHRLRRAAERRYPGLPYFMLGHSMGSFFLKAYLEMYGDGLSGAVVMGTGYYPDTVLRGGLRLIRRLALSRGWRHRSPLVKKLFFFGPFRRFDMTGKEPENSWLTKDVQAVQAYHGDERSQFEFSLNAYYNFLKTILYGNQKENLARIPKKLPILMLSGSDDPVGNFGRGVRRVERQFKAAGISQVSMKLYEGDRHEILNELDREQVYEDILQWYEEIISRPDHRGA